MGFYEYYYGNFKNINIDEFFNGVKDQDILNILQKGKIDKFDFLTLLSPQAENFLEQMAVLANRLSVMHFGKTVLLFTPMYISSFCVNKCAYCGFNVQNKFNRQKLTIDEIESEAKVIFATGLRHILLLTGESQKETPVSYIEDAVRVLKKYFDSVSIEIYPLDQDEYELLINAGVDGITIYQEVYNEEVYDRVHISGPKKDYKYRLDTPERACMAKMRSVNIGALLGLHEWRKEAFATGLHAQYLQSRYSGTEISVSLPRLRPHCGSFEDVHEVNDRNFVQILLALRIFLPYAGITISTRESKDFRDNLILLGVTKMSAGVTTKVGGHSLQIESEGQFEISDGRTVDEMKHAVLDMGYQPVFKDWMKF